MPPQAPILLCKSHLSTQTTSETPVFLFIFLHFALAISESTQSSPSMPPEPRATNLVPRFVPTLARFRSWTESEGLSTDPGVVDLVLEYDAAVDAINLKFAEAREEMEMAMESKETVYFDEEAECARAAAKEVIDRFLGPEAEKTALQYPMGLKMERFKAELVCDL